MQRTEFVLGKSIAERGKMAGEVQRAGDLGKANLLE